LHSFKPSSSSHTLIGGFAGAAIAHTGFESINSAKIVQIASFIVLAPAIGMFIAFLISIWFLHAFKKTILPKLVSLGVIIAIIVFLAETLLKMVNIPMMNIRTRFLLNWEKIL